MLETAQKRNLLVGVHLVALLSLPLIVVLSPLLLRVFPLTIDGARGVVEEMSSVLVISFVAYWAGAVVLLRRSQEHLRPPDRTHIGPGIRVDTIRLKRFREKQMDELRSKPIPKEILPTKRPV
jgi:hypothetical protein